MKETFLNFIDGEFRAGSTEKFLPVFEPATGEAYAQVVDSTGADVDAAVRAAANAFPSWSSLGHRERSQYLRRLSEAVTAKLELFAQAETRNTGKPIRLSRTVDIPRSAHNFEFFADAATQFASEAHMDPGMAVNYTLRQPLGVVGCISPWNLPLYLFTWKIAPALACGNTVVAKPSEITPHTAWLLSEVCREIGFPPGVLNIVHGAGASTGNAIVGHPYVRAVSFTGSTSVGAAIAAKTGASLKKASLELGGKNAFVVFPDCDWERTLDGAARAAFSNQGQICLSASRFIVEKSIYSRFKESLLERIAKLKQGDPSDPSTDQGAVVSKAHHMKILACLARARSEGASVLCGGKEATMSGKFEKGWFIQPTLLEGLPMQSATSQEEIFGPVASLHPFETEEEALALANDTQYGLSATLWTSDSSRILRLSGKLKAGIVWVNCWMVRDLRTPFGGVKNSGMGREGGWEAMRFFTEAKNVCIAE